MPPLTVMFKTVSSDCNLNCSYCYYRKSAAGSRQRHRLMPELLAAFFPQYMDYVADAGQAHLSWQGGEPLMAGRDFFQTVVGLEAAAARPPMVISNVIQTNATLVDRGWANFFARYNFLVGVSLDGPAAIHDIERKDVAGRGTFSRVMRGIEFLRAANVDFNILCVVGPHNVHAVESLLNFYTIQKFTHLQFMPAMAFQSDEPDVAPSYLVTAADYGEFLKQVFDIWYGNGLPRFSVRTFDNLLQSLLGINNDLCIHSESCHAGIVIEHNGDVYPCDFYIHPEYKLGNILGQSLKEMVNSRLMTQFIQRKQQQLPVICRNCEWKFLCRGECPRNWRTQADGAIDSSYFCQSYRALFDYAGERLKKLAVRAANYRRYLIQRRDKPDDKPAASGAPCPCGSGLNYEECCGLPDLQNCYLFC